MSTVTKKRFHVSLPAEAEAVLMMLSEQDNVPFATKASELLKEALEWHEDKILTDQLNQRRKDNAAFIPLSEIRDQFLAT